MVEFALAPNLDVAAASKSFARSGRAQLAPFLAPAVATALRQELVGRSDWREVFNVGERVYEVDRAGQSTLDAAARTRIDEGIAAAARTGFQYRYETLRVPDAAEQRTERGDLLASFARFMAEPEVLGLLRLVTGAASIDFADAQATWFRAGDFLTRHHDQVEGKGRQAAYVFGLTPEWRPDWGGLLLFHDGDDDIERGLTPRYNCLNLFAVPQEHSVSQVASYVTEPRLSVTGWLRQRAG
jgi:Rps23 Pro-64 3,4-dihydroxylase Tpa1-like proline 4-hydroxylase